MYKEESDKITPYHFFSLVKDCITTVLFHIFYVLAKSTIEFILFIKVIGTWFLKIEFLRLVNESPNSRVVVFIEGFWVRLAGDKLFFVTYRQRRGSTQRVVLPESI